MFNDKLFKYSNDDNFVYNLENFAMEESKGEQPNILEVKRI